jgi:hypothetical protein
VEETARSHVQETNLESSKQAHERVRFVGMKLKVNKRHLERKRDNGAGAREAEEFRTGVL